MTELSELLSQWEDRWLRVGVPVQEYLAPGTDPDRVRQVLTTAGFAVTQEAVDWFTWHDGARVHPGAFRPAPSPYLPTALEDVLPAYRSWREFGVATAADIAGEGFPDRENPDYYWEPTWLPIGSDTGGRTLAVDLQPGRDACPVRTIDAWASGEDGYRAVRASSLTTAVRTWLSWFDLGYWTWSEQQKHWEYDFGALPLELRLSDLL